MSADFNVIHTFTSTSKNTDFILLLIVFPFVVIGTFLIQWKCNVMLKANVMVKAGK